MAVLNAGRLDREIVLQRGTQGTDADTGEPVMTYVGETLWAEWRPADTREAWHARQRLNAYIEGVFRVYDMSPRPVPDKDRIIFEERVYDVKPYVEIGRGEGLEIPVTAVA